MALQIGDTPAYPSEFGRIPRPRALTSRGVQESSGPRPVLRAGNLENRPLFQQEETRPLRAGFGEGTISPSSAAARALGRNLEEARRLAPSIEDLREELRARNAEERKRLEGDDREERVAPRNRFTEELNVSQTQARAQARGFINGLNDAVVAARARFDPESAPQQPTIDIRIGNETLPFRTARPLFDVSI